MQIHHSGSMAVADSDAGNSDIVALFLRELRILIYLIGERDPS
jgi:hypothetical protein